MTKFLSNFSTDALKWLRNEAARMGISTAEVLRRIIDEKRGVAVTSPKSRK